VIFEFDHPAPNDVDRLAIHNEYSQVRVVVLDYPEAYRDFTNPYGNVMAEGFVTDGRGWLANEGERQVMRHLIDKIHELEDENTKLQSRVDRAYSERNYSVIMAARMALALGLKAGRGIDGNEEWDMEWRHVVYIQFPDGAQASWHISPAEVPLLDGLPEFDGEWDGTFLSRSPDLANICKGEKLWKEN